MNLEPGTLVLVLVGGTFHCAASVIQPAEPEGLVWLNVNTLGVHLPQMYRHDEITPIYAPSEIVTHGICLACWGLGTAEWFVREPDPGRCFSCNGTGRLADIATIDLDCEQCHKAFTPEA